MATTRRQVGRYQRSTVAGEAVSSFVPNSLPPRSPPLRLSPKLAEQVRLAELKITLLLEHWKLLSESLLYLSLYFKRHRAEYYRLLNAVRLEGDWEAWVAYFLEGVSTIADEAADTARDLFVLFEKDRGRVLAARNASVMAARLLEQQGDRRGAGADFLETIERRQAFDGRVRSDFPSEPSQQTSVRKGSRKGQFLQPQACTRTASWPHGEGQSASLLPKASVLEAQRRPIAIVADKQAHGASAQRVVGLAPAEDCILAGCRAQTVGRQMIEGQDRIRAGWNVRQTPPPALCLPDASVRRGACEGTVGRERDLVAGVMALPYVHADGFGRFKLDGLGHVADASGSECRRRGQHRSDQAVETRPSLP